MVELLATQLYLEPTRDGRPCYRWIAGFGQPDREFVSDVGDSRDRLSLDPLGPDVPDRAVRSGACEWRSADQVERGSQVGGDRRRRGSQAGSARRWNWSQSQLTELGGSGATTGGGLAVRVAVRKLMNSRAPIPGLDSPSRASRATSVPGQ